MLSLYGTVGRYRSTNLVHFQNSTVGLDRFFCDCADKSAVTECQLTKEVELIIEEHPATGKLIFFFRSPSLMVILVP